MEYRYTLEKYKGPGTRYTCPSCGHKREFTRYIDTHTNAHLSPIAGKCNRAGNCGYHYTPKQFFADNPGLRNKENNFSAQRHTPPKSRPGKVHIPPEILDRSYDNHNANPFIRFLHTILSPEAVSSVIALYNIGTCKGPTYWNSSAANNCTVFWFINRANEIRYGQVKLFYDNGHTAKYVNALKDNALGSCTTGIHYLLKSQYKKINQEPPQWLKQYEQQDVYMDCFFGENLLDDPEFSGRPVAIVEAPKTAIIAAAFMSHFLWLAVGSLSYLTAERCKVLEGKEVTLFPDLGAYDIWKDRANKVQNIHFKISHFLERSLDESQKVKGMDIADYFSGEYRSLQ